MIEHSLHHEIGSERCRLLGHLNEVHEGTCCTQANFVPNEPCLNVHSCGEASGSCMSRSYSLPVPTR